MVLDGYQCQRQPSAEEVAERTLAVLRRAVPAAVPGIAFLSGGQRDELAGAHLAALNAVGDAPWQLTFSYGRALQAAALKAWAGQEDNADRAQAIFDDRVRATAAARRGHCQPAAIA
jgi:fructose-bisphosphate aldolase class I